MSRKHPKPPKTPEIVYEIIPGMTRPTVIFRDPPPPSIGGRPRINWAAIATACKKRPGQWAYIGRHTTGTIGRISTGRLTQFTGNWDITTRNIPGQTIRDVYLRYNSPATSEDYTAYFDLPEGFFK